MAASETDPHYSTQQKVKMAVMVTSPVTGNVQVGSVTQEPDGSLYSVKNQPFSLASARALSVTVLPEAALTVHLSRHV